MQNDIQKTQGREGSVHWIKRLKGPSPGNRKGSLKRPLVPKKNREGGPLPVNMAKKGMAISGCLSFSADRPLR